MLHVRVLDVVLPVRERIAYVGGGGDRVNVWLTRLGLDVTVLDAPAFAADTRIPASRCTTNSSTSCRARCA